jgi:hypothetical protein
MFLGNYYQRRKYPFVKIRMLRTKKELVNSFPGKVR